MATLNPEDLLTLDEFEALTDKDQASYLALLEKAETAWTLTGKQVVADALADQVTELLYGGAAGGGKSEWILNRAWRKSREVPTHRTLILRTKLKELRRSIVARSLLLYAQHTPKEDMPRWKAADLEWHFPNGSVIEFGYCQTDEDVGQYLSAEYDMIAFDEATQFTQYQYELIRSRARSPISKMKRGARPHIIAATNPGSRGHAFFKSTFVDPTNFGETGATYLERDSDDRWRMLRRDIEELTEAEQMSLRHVAFVPSTVADNPHMTKEYIASLMTLPEKQKRRMLHGDWDLPEGMFFTEFSRNKVSDDGTMTPYHVIDPFPIPDSWQKITATDYGFASPFSTVWLAWDPDGRCYVYREVYQARLSISQQANLVATNTPNGERIRAAYADPACWAKNTSLTIADQWKDAGWRVQRAKNDRIAGWMRVREYLLPRDDGMPSLQIFSNCHNLIRTLPDMMHDDVNPEDIDTDLEDHLADALRYGLMTRPLPSIHKKSKLDAVTKHFESVLSRNRKKKNQIDF